MTQDARSPRFSTMQLIEITVIYVLIVPSPASPPVFSFPFIQTEKVGKKLKVHGSFHLFRTSLLLKHSWRSSQKRFGRKALRAMLVTIGLHYSPTRPIQTRLRFGVGIHALIDVIYIPSVKPYGFPSNKNHFVKADVTGYSFGYMTFKI